MADVLVVTSRVKAFVAKKHKMRTGADFIDSLSDEVEKLVEAAVARAKEDKRGTLKSRDIGEEG